MSFVANRFEIVVHYVIVFRNNEIVSMMCFYDAVVTEVFKLIVGTNYV